MIDQDRQLVLGETAGKRHGHCPCLDHPEVEGNPVGRVHGTQTDVLARMNTHSNEARGDPVGPLVKLSICRFTACLADSGVVGKEKCRGFKIVGKIHRSEPL